jgi:hypothetical protein
VLFSPVCMCSSLFIGRAHGTEFVLFVSWEVGILPYLATSLYVILFMFH